MSFGPMTVRIKVIGADEAVALFDPSRIGRGVREGLVQAAGLIERDAKATIKPHHWQGKAERSIHTLARGSGIDSEVFVGSNQGRAPHFRSLSYGWPGGKGKQPPSSAILRWLVTKPEIANSSKVFRNKDGFVRRTGSIAAVSKDSHLKSLAFLIARKIGKKGFSFKPLEPFERAFDRQKRHIKPLILKAIAKER